jgi:hypothetical protein
MVDALGAIGLLLAIGLFHDHLGSLQKPRSDKI